MARLKYNYPISPQDFLEEVTGKTVVFNTEENIETQIRKIMKSERIKIRTWTLESAAFNQYSRPSKDYYLVDLSDSEYNEQTEEFEMVPNYRFICCEKPITLN